MNLFNNIFTDYKSQLHSAQAQLSSLQDENKRLTNDSDDYKTRLKICQDEYNRVKDELAVCQLRLHVSEVKNRQFANDLEVIKHENAEMIERERGSDSSIKIHNHDYREREELVNVLTDENNKLKKEVTEMRRVIINRKRL